MQCESIDWFLYNRNIDQFVNPLVKHTQAICRLLPTNRLSLFDHFVGLTPPEIIRKP